MLKIKNSQFRKLEPSHLMIVNIYSPYRMGWVESEKKNKTYVYFPNTCTADVVYSWDPSATMQEGEKKVHLRLQEWDNEARKFKFTKVGNVDLKVFKKVYDVEFAVSSPVDVKVWDGTQSKEVDYSISSWEVIRVTGFPASRIQGICESFMLMKGIEKVDANVTDRLTWEKKVEKRLPFDWEEGVLRQLKDKCFEFAVNGSWLETKYSFREVPSFEVKEVEEKKWVTIEDLPF